MNAIFFSALFGFAILQVCVAEDLGSHEGAEIIQHELDIIGYCTELPYRIKLLEKEYESLNETNANEKISEMKKQIQYMVSETDEFKDDVNSYTSAVEENDPKAIDIQKQVFSALKTINSSLKTLRNDLEQDSILSVDERKQFMQDVLRPAVAKLTQSCLAETEDILQNVIGNLSKE